MADMDLTPRSDPEAIAAPAKKKRNLAAMLLLVAVLVAGGVIVTQFLSSAVDYFCNVDEVGVRDGCETERRIRLQGTVDPGSIDQSVPGVTAFTMTFNDATIPVHYDGDPGGIFQECIPVIVHGEIYDDVLDGDRLEVRHSDEYEAENQDNLSAAQAQVEAECNTANT
jgi:cytochrome c-type biogenesis protein CcmE